MAIPPLYVGFLDENSHSYGIKHSNGRQQVITYQWNPETSEFEPATKTQKLYKILVDEFSDTITYVGEAEAGALLNLPVWRIKRISTSHGVEIAFADGDIEFNNIWEDRLTKTYS